MYPACRDSGLLKVYDDLLPPAAIGCLQRGFDRGECVLRSGMPSGMAMASQTKATHLGEQTCTVELWSDQMIYSFVCVLGGTILGVVAQGTQ